MPRRRIARRRPPTAARLATRRLTAAGTLLYAIAALIYLGSFGLSLDGFHDPQTETVAAAGRVLSAEPGASGRAVLAASRAGSRVVVEAAVPVAVAARPGSHATMSGAAASSRATKSTPRRATDLAGGVLGDGVASIPAAEVADFSVAAAELVRDAGVSVAAGLDAAVPAAAAASGPTVGGRVQPKLVISPRAASGSYLVVPGRGEPSVAVGGQVIRYVVEVERGLPFDAEEFAADVHRILNDPRGWGANGTLGFERVDHGPVRMRVSLSSPALTDTECAPLRTFGRVSCWNGSRAVINALRWGTGAATYGTDILAYREYLISHEVGHGLGHRHVHCTTPGEPAPIMVQQTKSLEGCLANAWPRPDKQAAAPDG